MFEKRRSHFLILFNKIISEMSPIFLVIISALIFGASSDSIYSSPLFLIGILLLTMSGRVVSYLCTTYELTPEIFYIRSGIINKKVMEIPVESVTSVNFSQNVLFQILDVFLIKIDTVSSISLTAPLFAFKKNDALEFQSLLMANRNRIIMSSATESEMSEQLGYINNVGNVPAMDSGDPNVYIQEDYTIEHKAPIKSIILLGLLEKKLQYILLPLMPFIYILQIVPDFIVDIFEFVAEDEQIGDYIDFFSDISMSRISWYVLLFAFIIIMVTIAIFYVSAVVISVVSFLVKYANFTIKKSDKSLRIEYGLLNKKAITLSNKKISGVVLKQSFLMRIFGYYTVEALVSGYGDTQNEFKVILFPIGKKEEIESIVSFALPEVRLEKEYTREKEGTLRYFFYNFLSIFSLCLLMSSIYLLVSDPINLLYAALVVLGIMISIVHVISCILRYNMEKMSIGIDTISFVKGGLSSEIIYLKTSRTETASYITSIFKRKKKIGHIVIEYFGPVGKNSYKMLNYRRNDYDSVKSNLIY